MCLQWSPLNSNLLFCSWFLRIVQFLSICRSFYFEKMCFTYLQVYRASRNKSIRIKQGWMLRCGRQRDPKATSPPPTPTSTEPIFSNLDFFWLQRFGEFTFALCLGQHFGRKIIHVGLPSVWTSMYMSPPHRLHTHLIPQYISDIYNPLEGQTKPPCHNHLYLTQNYHKKYQNAINLFVMGVLF